MKKVARIFRQILETEGPLSADVFDNPQNEWHRVLSKINKGIAFANKHTRTLLVALVILTVGVSLIFAPRSLASMAVFYPSACEGGWTNPDNAAQGPTIDDISPASLYTSSNSAVLDGSHGDLVCGTFFGTIPSGSTPKAFSVKIHWSFDDGSIQHDGVVHDSAAPVTLPSLDGATTPSSDSSTAPAQPAADSSSDSVAVPTLDGNPTSISSDEPPADAASPAPETTPVETPTATPSDSSTDTPAPTPADAAPAPDTSSVSDATSSLGALVLDGTSDSHVITPGTGVLDVRYTLDGDTWTTIGAVDASDWQSAAFTISDPNVQSWGDLSKLKVGLFSLAQSGNQPAVYVDSMEIDVNYDPQQSTSVPTVRVSDPSIAIVTPDKPNFSLDESPTFSVSDPALSADQLQTLVQTSKATVLDDKLGVFGSAINLSQKDATTNSSTDSSVASTPSGSTSANSSALSAAVSPVAPDAPDTTLVPTPAETATPNTDATSPVTPAGDSSFLSANPLSSDFVDSFTAAPSTPDSTPVTPPSGDTSPSSTMQTPDTSAAPSAPADAAAAADAPVEPVLSSLAGAFAAGASVFDQPLAGEKTDLQKAEYVPTVAPSKQGAFARAWATTELFIYKAFTSASMLSRSLQAFVGATPPPMIDAVVLDAQGNETTIATSVQHVVVNGVEKDQVVVDKPERMFRPGKYTLRVTLHTLEANIVSEQDFSWGVLAINVDKSVYHSGDTAYVQMGVINDLGHTICNADMTLVVTGPDGLVMATYSTGSGSITQESSCGPDNFISVPDYYAHIPAGSTSGTYGLTLTATTDNGPRTVYDEYQVTSDAGFDVVRTGPTRIYPVDAYPMKIDITSPTDWTGTVVETMPSLFTPSVLDAAYPEYTVTTVGDNKMLTWHLSLAAGVPTTIGYSFLAPPVSPEFYLLGPLAFYGVDDDPTSATPVFQESRRWQIADDATCATIASGNWSDSTIWNCGHVPASTSSDSATISTGNTVTLDANEPATGGLQGVLVNGTLLAPTAKTVSTTTLTIGSGGAIGSAGVNAAIFNLSGTGTELVNNGGTYTAGTSTIGGYGSSTTFDSVSGTGTFTGANALNNLTIANATTFGADMEMKGLFNIAMGSNSTVSTGNFNLTAANFNITGVIGSGGPTFNMGSSTLTLNGTTGTLFTNGIASCSGSYCGFVTAGTSTVKIVSDASVAAVGLFGATSLSLYNMILQPVLTAPRTYTINSVLFHVTNLFESMPASSGGVVPQTLTLGGTAAWTMNAGTLKFIGNTDTITTTAMTQGLVGAVLDIEPGGNFAPGAVTVSLYGGGSTIMTMNGGSFSGTSSTIAITSSGTSTFNTAGFTGANQLGSLYFNPPTGATITFAADVTMFGSFTVGGPNTGSVLTAGYNVIAGSLVVWGGLGSSGTGPTLNLGSSTVTLNGSSSPLVNWGVTGCIGSSCGILTSSGANFIVTSTATVTFNGGSQGPTLNSLSFTPVLPTSSTITMSSGSPVVLFSSTADFTVNPTGTGVFTLNMHGATTLNAAHTMLIEACSATLPCSASAVVDTTASNYSMTMGHLDLETGGTLVAEGSNISINSTSGIGLKNVGGTFTRGTSTVTITAGGGTLNNGGFTGSGVGGNALNNLTINISSGTTTLGGNIEVVGLLNDFAGTFDTGSPGWNVIAGTMSQSVSGSSVINANGSTITLNGTTGTIFTRSVGVFNAGTSTVIYNGNGDITTVSATTTYYNLIFSPVLTANHTYTTNMTTLVNHQFTVSPTSSGGPFTLSLAGTAMYFGTCAFVVQGDSATMTTFLNNLTVGTVDIEPTGKLNVGTVTFTTVGTTGPIFTLNGGYFDSSTSTIVVSGVATTTLATAGFVTSPFNNLSITAGGAVYTLAAPMNLKGRLSVSTGTLDFGSPGYAVTAAYFTLANTTTAILNLENATFTLNGTTGTLITKNGIGSMPVTGTSTILIVSNADVTVSDAGFPAYNIVMAPVLTGNHIYTLSSGTITYTGSWTVNPTASVTASLTVNLGVGVTVPTTGTLTIEGCSGVLPCSATGIVNTVAASSFAVLSGHFDIELGGVFASNNSAVTVTGTSGTLWTQAGTMSGTGTVTFNGAATTGLMTSGSNVVFPANVTLANSAFVVPLGANTTIVGTLTIGSSTVIGGTLDTNSGTPGSYALSAGFISMPTNASSKLLGNSSTITLTGTGVGVLFTKGASAVWTPGSSTVLVASASGSPKFISAAMTFYNITIATTGAAVVDINVGLTVTNVFRITSPTYPTTASVFNTEGQTLTGTGATLQIDANATLCLGGTVGATNATCDSGATYGGPAALPTFATYTLDPASTIAYMSDFSTAISAAPAYGNLVFRPVLTVGRTYSFLPFSIYTVKGDFTLTPTAASALQLSVTPSGTSGGAPVFMMTVAGTMTMSPRGSATVREATVSGNSISLGVGNLDIKTGATLDAHAAGAPSVNTTMVTTSGNLLIENGGTLSIGSGSTTLCFETYVGGSFTNNGTLTTTSPATCAPLVMNGGTTSSFGGSGGGFTFSQFKVVPSEVGITLGVTIASPGVIYLPLHGLSVGDPITFSTNGALPTGITAGTTYYVISAGFTNSSFEISTTPGGSPVTTSGTQSGAHTITRVNDLAKEVDFAPSITVTPSSSFVVTGHGGKLVRLFSSSPGTAWNIVPPTSNTVTFADVQDSACTHVAGHDITATSSTDDGGNSLTPTGCWSFGLPYINFMLSTNVVDFGPLSLLGSRYATPLTGGASSDTLDTITSSAYATVATSAGNGYTLFVQGATLGNSSYGYSLPGMSLATPSFGTDQFGMRVVASGGSGVALSPYNTSQFAYTANATTPVAIGSLGSASLRTTTYFMHYVANVSTAAPVGNYSTTLTYVAVPNF